MPSGLIALLDDVAGIARLAAASIDDVGAAAGKASIRSTGTTVSARAGNGAPVMISQADASSCGAGCPAAMRAPISHTCAVASGRPAATSATPSSAALSNGGSATGLTTSWASTRPTASPGAQGCTPSRSAPPHSRSTASR